MPLVTYSWLAVALAIACAAIGWLGIGGWIATAVVAASIAAHVAGNALGTKLREATDRRLATRRKGRVGLPFAPAPPVVLGARAPLGRLVPVSVGIGAACGGAAGATALSLLTRASLPGAILGGVSSAVVGGLFGFLLASFVEVVRTSLREAIAAEDGQASPPRSVGTSRS